MADELSHPWAITCTLRKCSDKQVCWEENTYLDLLQNRAYMPSFRRVNMHAGDAVNNVFGRSEGVGGHL